MYPKENKHRSITPMNLNTVKEFRHGVYGCFGHAKDALFNLVDALSSEAGPAAFPNCRSRRFLNGHGPACTKPWRTAKSMPSDCAKCFSNVRRCPRQASSSFWEWTPATCIALRPRPQQIERWFPSPICPRTRTPLAPAG